MIMVFFLRRCPLRSHRQSTTADAAPRGEAHHSQASSLARPSDLSGHELPTVWGVYGLARGRSEGCGASASGPRLCVMLRHQRIANLYAWLFCGEPGGRASADAVPEAMPFWRKLRQPCASGGTRPPVFYIPKWLCRRSAACLRGPASAARPGPADVRPPQTLRQVPRLAHDPPHACASLGMEGPAPPPSSTDATHAVIDFFEFDPNAAPGNSGGARGRGNLKNSVIL